MSAFREMIIEWDGEKYDFTPSNKFLRKVDREVSLAQLSSRAAKGDAPIFDMAYVISEVLREAGVEITEDDVITEITQEGNQERAQYLVSLIDNLMPQPEAKGGKGAEGKSKAGKKK